jgi:hypothetical protein
MFPFLITAREGGIDYGVEELVFDPMEFGVSHTKALLRNPIISIYTSETASLNQQS